MLALHASWGHEAQSSHRQQRQCCAFPKNKIRAALSDNPLPRACQQTDAAASRSARWSHGNAGEYLVAATFDEEIGTESNCNSSRI